MPHGGRTVAGHTVPTTTVHLGDGPAGSGAVQAPRIIARSSKLGSPDARMMATPGSTNPRRPSIGMPINYLSRTDALEGQGFSTFQIEKPENALGNQQKKFVNEDAHEANRYANTNIIHLAVSPSNSKMGSPGAAYGTT